MKSKRSFRMLYLLISLMMVFCLTMIGSKPVEAKGFLNTPLRLTGIGETEDDPVIVTNYSELKTALGSSRTHYIRVTGNVTASTVTVADSKNAGAITVSGEKNITLLGDWTIPVSTTADYCSLFKLTSTAKVNIKGNNHSLTVTGDVTSHFRIFDLVNGSQLTMNNMKLIQNMKTFNNGSANTNGSVFAMFGNPTTSDISFNLNVNDCVLNAKNGSVIYIIGAPSASRVKLENINATIGTAYVNFSQVDTTYNYFTSGVINNISDTDRTRFSADTSNVIEKTSSGYRVIRKGNNPNATVTVDKTEAYDQDEIGFTVKVDQPSWYSTVGYTPSITVTCDNNDDVIKKTATNQYTFTGKIPFPNAGYYDIRVKVELKNASSVVVASSSYSKRVHINKRTAATNLVLNNVIIPKAGQKNATLVNAITFSGTGCKLVAKRCVNTTQNLTNTGSFAASDKVVYEFDFEANTGYMFDKNSAEVKFPGDPYYYYYSVDSYTISDDGKTMTIVTVLRGARYIRDVINITGFEPPTPALTVDDYYNMLHYRPNDVKFTWYENGVAMPREQAFTVGNKYVLKIRAIDTIVAGVDSTTKLYLDDSEDYLKKSTFTYDGDKTISCETVEFVLSEEQAQSCDHNYSKYVSNGDGTHKVVCKACGAVQPGHDKDKCSGGTATTTAKAKCSKCGKEYSELVKVDPSKPVETPNVSVSYRTHVQSIGWQNYVKDGKSAGTYGMAKRLEGINIKVEGNDKLGVIYTTHCQTYGWLPWSANGDMNGTEGEAKRLEAIEIKLTGADKDKYDIYYRVHAQSYGWLGWAKNGAPAGTAGYGKRLEAIQIIVKKKGEAAPSSNPPVNEGVVYKDASNGGIAKAFYAKDGQSPIVNNPSTSNTNPVIPGESLSTVAYRTHVQSYGWQGWKFNGQMSGTSGEAKRLEGIDIKLVNKQYAGGIRYTTHVQSYGWQGDENNSSTWKKDGDMAGTLGEAKRLEAIKIELYGEMANQYDVYYRVHAQSYGWLGWAKNGASSGTAGYGKRLEGIQIVLVKKGDPAPANTYMGITSVKTESYIKK